MYCTLDESQITDWQKCFGKKKKKIIIMTPFLKLQKVIH